MAETPRLDAGRLLSFATAAYVAVGMPPEDVRCLTQKPRVPSDNHLA